MGGNISDQLRYVVNQCGEPQIRNLISYFFVLFMQLTFVVMDVKAFKKKVAE